MNPPKQSGILVDGIVAARNKEPYVVITANGKERVQISIAEARKIAADIVQAAARAEADAMIHKFFSAQEFPEGAHVAVMLAFREFRLKLDAEPVEGFAVDPDKGNEPQQ